MAAAEVAPGGERRLSWRQRMGLAAAYTLLATPVVTFGEWALTAGCRNYVIEEAANASFQAREPSPPPAICDYNERLRVYLDSVSEQVQQVVATISNESS